MFLIGIEYLFYLLPIAIISGPFFADIFCSTMALFFLILIIINKNFYYLYNFYSLIFFSWLAFLLLSSLKSNYVLLSLESSLFYFRFGLFFLSILYILKNNINNLNFFYFFLKIGLLFLIVDGYFQYFVGFNLLGFENINDSRLSGIYGDEYVLGSTIIRLLPLYFGLVFYYNNQKLGFIFYSIYFLYLPLLFIIGERTAILLGILCFILTTSFLIYTINYKKILLIVFSIFICFFIIFSNNSIKKRIIDLTIHQLTDQTSGKLIFPKEYSVLYLTSFNMFLDKPLLGHGPKSYRKVCAEKKYHIITNQTSLEDNCTTHPHNIYFQLLSETGIIGSLPIILFFIFVLIEIVKTYIKLINNHSDNNKRLYYFVLIALLLTLWPLIPAGNFFNNWLSTIYFLPVGFMIYLRNKIT